MRRLLIPCALVALLVFPAAAAARPNAPGDGTLVVRNGSGTINLVATGAVIGSCDHCSVTIVDPQAGDGSGPIVSGEESKVDLNDTKSRWSGDGVRFRLIGGFFRLRVFGTGIDLSAVGRGQGTIRGAGTLNDGTYAVNGGDRRPLPDDLRTFWLGAPPTIPIG
jgi:hypothetical protein